MTINQGKSLPAWLRMTIGLLICVAIITILRTIREPYSIGLAIGLSVLFPAAWFSTKILQIDLKSNKIFLGHWSMGFRFGKTRPFSNLSITTKKASIELTHFTLPNNQTMSTDTEFHAYLEMDNEAPLYLFGHPVKSTFDKKIKVLHEKLGISTS